MKSIKPGRGPSAMGAAGGAASVLFGIFWTVMAFTMTKGAPFPINVFFPLFGIVFIGIGVMNTIFHYKNATSKNRMSLMDITDASEEPDPLNQKFGLNTNETNLSSSTASTISRRKFEGDYCPYCGTKVEENFDFCPKCGKDI